MPQEAQRANPNSHDVAAVICRQHPADSIGRIGEIALPASCARGAFCSGLSFWLWLRWPHAARVTNSAVTMKRVVVDCCERIRKVCRNRSGVPWFQAKLLRQRSSKLCSRRANPWLAVLPLAGLIVRALAPPPRSFAGGDDGRRIAPRWPN